MVLLYSTYRSPALYNTAILDAILKEGDEMYMNYPHTRYFEYTELPRQVTIKPTFAETPLDLNITFGDVLFGKMSQTFSDLNSMQFSDAINIGTSDITGCYRH